MFCLIWTIKAEWTVLNSEWALIWLQVKSGGSTRMFEDKLVCFVVDTGLFKNSARQYSNIHGLGDAYLLKMLCFGSDPCLFLQCWTRFCKSSGPWRMQRGPAGRWNRVWQSWFASGKKKKKPWKIRQKKWAGARLMELCLKGRGGEERDDTGGRDRWFCLKEN